MINHKIYTSQKYLLRGPMKMATVIKKIPDTEKYLVEYYDINNVLRYAVVTTDDIIFSDEYEILRTRQNKINKILK